MSEYRKEQIRIAVNMSPKMFGLKDREYLDVDIVNDEVVLSAYNLSVMGDDFDWRPTPHGRGFVSETEKAYIHMSQNDLEKNMLAVINLSPLHKAIVEHIGYDAGEIQADWVKLPEKKGSELFSEYKNKEEWTPFPRNSPEVFYSYLTVGNASIKIEIQQ